MRGEIFRYLWIIPALVLYSGCQRNVPLPQRFFLQPLMPLFLIPEHNYGKRYSYVITFISRLDAGL